MYFLCLLRSVCPSRSSSSAATPLFIHTTSTCAHVVALNPQRIPPKYCLWLDTDRIQWFISPEAEDYAGRLVEGPDDQDKLADPEASWHAIRPNVTQACPVFVWPHPLPFSKQRERMKGGFGGPVSCCICTHTHTHTCSHNLHIARRYGVKASWTFNNVVKCGYLVKSPPAGAMKGGWKKRFFVLLGPSEESGEAKLEYYEIEVKRQNPLSFVSSIS